MQVLKRTKSLTPLKARNKMEQYTTKFKIGDIVYTSEVLSFKFNRADWEQSDDYYLHLPAGIKVKILSIRMNILFDKIYIKYCCMPIKNRKYIQNTWLYEDALCSNIQSAGKTH